MKEASSKQVPMTWSSYYVIRPGEQCPFFSCFLHLILFILLLLQVHVPPKTHSLKLPLKNFFASYSASSESSLHSLSHYFSTSLHYCGPNVLSNILFSLTGSPRDLCYATFPPYQFSILNLLSSQKMETPGSSNYTGDGNVSDPRRQQSLILHIWTSHIKVFIYCRIWGSHSGSSECCHLLGYSTT
jgi:hypothetical protein